MNLLSKVTVPSVALGVLALPGCDFGLGEQAMAQARRTQVMALLKQYQVGQMIYRYEERGSQGGYGRLEELWELDEDLVDARLYRAWDRHSDPVPVGGFLIAELDSDRRRRAGLCAYPEDPEEQSTMLLMLLDDADPEEWAFYEGELAPGEKPPRRWPGRSTLSRFVRLEKRSPFGAQPNPRPQPFD